MYNLLRILPMIICFLSAEYQKNMPEMNFDT